MSKSKNIWIIFILGTLSAFGPLSIDMYVSALPSIQKQLHSSASSAQLTITACLIGLALGQIFIGPLSDRIGRKRPTLISLILFTLASFAIAFVTNIWLFIFFRLIQGLSGSVSLATSKAMCSDLYEGQEFIHYYYLLMAVNSVFPVFAPSLGGLFLLFGSWRLIFIALGIISISLFIAVYFFDETLSKDNAQKAKSFPSFKGIIHNKRFLYFALVSCFMTGALFAYIAGSSFMLQDFFGISAVTFSLIYTINGIGQVLFTWLGGKLALKFSENKLLLISILLSICSSIWLLLTLFLPQKLILVIIPLFLIVSLVGIGNPIGSGLAIQQERQFAGTASAIIGLIQYLIGGLISPLVGIGSTHSYVSMAIIIFICEFVALICWFLSSKNK